MFSAGGDGTIRWIVCGNTLCLSYLSLYLLNLCNRCALRMWRSVLEDREGSIESPIDSEACAVFEGHKHDVYSVICRDGGASIVSAGYDRMVREWDVSTARQVPASPISSLLECSLICCRSSK